MRKNTRHRTRKKHTRRTKTKSSHSKRRKQGNKYGGKDLRVVQASKRWVIHRKISSPHGKRQRGGGRGTKGDFLGKGHFGSVYECSVEGVADGQRYAMKVFDSIGKTDIGEMYDNMMKEIEYTQKVHGLATDPEYKHLNLKTVEVIYFQWEPPLAYYVQTLLTGGDMKQQLDKYISRDPPEHWNENFWKPAFRDIANYIYLCNINEIYHNDIKLENVMLDRLVPPRAYVVDLGFATEKVAAKRKGTTQYMPPGSFDHSCEKFPRDIWAFGILVSEMLLGRLFPYKDPGYREVQVWRKAISTSPDISETLKLLLQLILYTEEDHLKGYLKRLTDASKFKTRIDTWFNTEEDEGIPPEFREQHKAQQRGTCIGSSCGARFINLFRWGGGGYAQKKRTRRKRKTPRTRGKRTRRKRTRRKRTRRTRRR